MPPNNPTLYSNMTPKQEKAASQIQSLPCNNTTPFLIPTIRSTPYKKTPKKTKPSTAVAPKEMDFPADAPPALVVLVVAGAPVPLGLGAVVGEPGLATVPFYISE